MDPISKAFFDVLFFFYKTTGDLGTAIIVFTLLVRSVMLPLSLPSMKSQKKMQDLKPEMDEIKRKYGHDKAEMQKKQLELYQKSGVNPLGGCLPYLIQWGFFIVLYNVLRAFVGTSEVGGIAIQTAFWGIDLAKPDPTYILPILAGVSQMLLSFMLLPGATHRDIIPNDSKKMKVREANAREEDTMEMAETIQKQMMLFMPITMGIVAARFPAGVALYWVVSTVYSLAQQIVVSGPGGLKVAFDKILDYVKKK